MAMKWVLFASFPIFSLLKWNSFPIGPHAHVSVGACVVWYIINSTLSFFNDLRMVNYATFYFTNRESLPEKRNFVRN